MRRAGRGNFRFDERLAPSAVVHDREVHGGQGAGAGVTEQRTTGRAVKAGPKCLQF